MASFVTLPGIGGSGETHWQSYWEAYDPSFTRFQPTDWERPNLVDWRQALETAIDASKEPPVLVAHSLACLLVAHAAQQIAGRVRGAVLVAVPDPSSPVFPAEATGFGNLPRYSLPFSTLIIASSNDPYAAPEYVRARSREWGAGFVDVGACGHINGTSNLGTWGQGRMLLDAFCAGIRA